MYVYNPSNFDVNHAAAAAKLDVANTGTSNKPVYFNNDNPVACGFTVDKSVPSDAKFTDTVYTHPTGDGYNHIPSGGNAEQILRYDSAGKAKWGNDINTTYSTGTYSYSGTTKLYSSFGNATDGTMTQAAIKSALDGKQTAGSYAAANHTHSNYLTGITSAMVTNALGYTPPKSDTNTWRGIQNNLTSTSTSDSLSAYQGKVLKGLVDGKAAASHTHSQYLTGIDSIMITKALGGTVFRMFYSAAGNSPQSVTLPNQEFWIAFIYRSAAIGPSTPPTTKTVSGLLIGDGDKMASIAMNYCDYTRSGTTLTISGSNWYTTSSGSFTIYVYTR